MKLVIRSQYWGGILKGKPRVDASNATRSFRTISSQAVLSNEGQYWGCCQGQGKRVLEMTEKHFLDCYPGEWDLYLVATSSSESQAIHTFFLMPQNQVSIDVTHQTCFNGWYFYGTLSATSMRQNLKDLLADTFKPNETIGFRYHHVHIEILMSQVIDYATREKKLKAKSELDAADSNTEKTKEDITEPTDDKSNASKPTIPPVVRSDSYDASWATETTSSPLTCASYQEVSKFNNSVPFDQDMICYPVAMPYHTMMLSTHTMPHHLVYPNNPHYAHHQGYTMMNAGAAMPMQMPVPHAGLAPYGMQAQPIQGFYPMFHPEQASYQQPPHGPQP